MGCLHKHEESLWNRHEISIKTKTNVYKAIRSILLYACENWPLKAEETCPLEVFDHRYLRHILRVSRWSHISNAEVRSHCAQKVPLSMIIKQRRQKFLEYTLRRPAGAISRDVLTCFPLPTWKWTPRGQRKNLWQRMTWIFGVASADTDVIRIRTGWRLQ